METGSKIEKLVIGARDLKDHLGRYLVQGLVVSVFLHSAIVTLVGMWPSEKQSAGKEIIVRLDPAIPRIREKQPPDVANHPRPKPPEKPDATRFVPVDEPMIDTTVVDPQEDLPVLSNTPNHDGTIDTGFVEGGELDGIDTSIDVAGYEVPEFVFCEVYPVPLEMNPQPEYPELARRASVDGKVTFWVHVSEKGNVIGWQVIDVKPAGLGFEDEVARVIPKWKFTPAIQQNNPIAVWVAIPFKFRVSE